MAFYSSLLESLPSTPGLLPSWLLFISTVSFFNSIQTYFPDLSLTRKVYSTPTAASQVTNLSARTFGTWTVLASVIRFYGAYYLNFAPIYDITMASFVVAGLHFSLEWLVYGTVKFDKGLAGPGITASLSIFWMALQRDYYLSQ